MKTEIKLSEDWKCKLNKKYCKHLTEIIGMKTQKGFSAVQTVDLKTMESKNKAVVYKKHPTDEGIIINYCPFCGVMINPYSY